MKFAKFSARTVLHARLPLRCSGIGLCATASTATAIVLILVAMFTNMPSSPVEQTPPSFVSFFLGFGAILFSFGGVSIFPTVQQDMKNPENFPIAANLSFLGKAPIHPSRPLTVFNSYSTTSYDHYVLAGGSERLPNLW
jgi:hypothetical protein